MSELTPETFEEEKYVDYFPKLQTAYKRAFDEMNEAHDSDLVHGIDQGVLAESEPHYEGGGEFTIELPEEPTTRLQGVLVSDEEAERVLEEYVARIETHLQDLFDVPGGEDGSGGGQGTGSGDGTGAESTGGEDGADEKA